MKNITSFQKKIRQNSKELAQLETSLGKIRSHEKKALQSIAAQQKKQGKLLKKSDPLIKEAAALKKRGAALKKKQKNLAAIALETKNIVFDENSPQFLVTDLSTEYPILLFPVRTQTRFIKVKHVATGLQPKDVLDVSETPTADKRKISSLLNEQQAFLLNQFDNSKKLETDRDKTMLSPLPLSSTNNKARPATVKNLPQQKPTDGINLIPDGNELWLRIYPDDIFVHTHEEGFTQDEVLAVQGFWEEVHHADTVHKNKPKERYDAKVAAWRALVNGFGTFRASYLVRTHRPKEVTFSKGEPILKTVPKLPKVPIKDGTWTKAPCTYILPDQFVVRLYSGKTFREVTGKSIPEILIVGLPPENDDQDAFELETEARKIPDDVKWLTDFQEAEKIGMALRIPISTIEAAKGFQKIVVLGIKFSQDENQGGKTVSRLFENHQYAMGGMGFLKQGTPTNNTTDSSVEALAKTEEESSFKAVMAPQYTPTNQHANKKDGQFLSEALGIAHESIHHIENSGGTDICEAIATNKALYPATLGYALRQFYGNNIGAATRHKTRSFFQNFVLGRGLLPAFRIDNQPYGMIPASSLSQWTYGKSASDVFYKTLHTKALAPFRNIWKSHFSKLHSLHHTTTNVDQLSDRFLEIMGLHATSIDFYQRIVAGPKALSSFSNQAAIAKQQKANKTKFQQLFSMSAGWILDYGCLKSVRELSGPMIDRQPLSESRGLEKLKGTEKNYIDFLLESGISTIEQEKFVAFSPENPIPPYSLFYMLLRHAMLQEYLDLASRFLVEVKQGSVLIKHDFELDQLVTSKKIRPEHEEFLSQVMLTKNLPGIEKKSNLAFKKQIKTSPDLQDRKRIAEAVVKNEMDKVEKEIAQEIRRQKANFTIENNKFDWFKKEFTKLTGNLTLGAYIEKLEKEKDKKVASLKHIKDSLDKIKDIPTARLERCFAEHLDCCNYRLDAWQTGLYYQRLSEMRKKNKEGTYLGSFAIVEGPKPNGTPGIHIQPVKVSKTITGGVVATKKVNPVIDSSKFSSTRELSSFLKKAYVYLGSDRKESIRFNSNTNSFVATAVEDNTLSEGFVHAPSTNQAISAAILKSGFDAHKGEDELSEALAVKLNSKRVRKALYILQGMRNGQEIGALLGYHFERGLHDHPLGNLDQFILDIRILFPSSAEKSTDTGGTHTVSSEALSVVDGMTLLEAFQKKSKAPKEIENLTGITTKQIAAIEGELIKLDDVLDAVNDLMVAESVFQIVVGSPDGSSAALKVLNESGDINQMPEIINVPRKGNALTHKVGIQIPIENKKTAWKATSAPSRTKLNAVLNNWLARQLPAPEKIIIRVLENNNAKIASVSMADLKIEPLEFVLGLGAGTSNTQNGEIPVRAKLFLAASDSSFAQMETLTVRFRDVEFSSGSKFSVYELLPLVRALYQVLTASRTAMPEDMVEQSKVAALDAGNGTVNNTDIRNGLGDIIMNNGNGSLEKVQKNLSLAIDNLAVITKDKPLTKADKESYLNLCERLMKASDFNIPAAVPQTHIGFSFQTRDILVQQAGNVLEQLETKKLKVRELLNAVPDSDSSGGRDNFENLKLLAGELFGRNFPLLPRFSIANKSEFNTAFESNPLADADDPFVLEDWLLGLSVVRPELKNYQNLVYLRELFKVADQKRFPRPVQLPHAPGGDNSWLGNRIESKDDIALDPLSLVFEFPSNFSAGTEQMAFVLDEWTEVIPENTIDSGVALHYNAPNSEASQNLLLAIPPIAEGNWQWEQLMDAVNDTMELAKIRAVEPKHLRQDALLFRILPGIIAAINAEGNTVSLDFGRNNVKPSIKFFPKILDINFSKAIRNE